jgi:hypothetical protein
MKSSANQKYHRTIQVIPANALEDYGVDDRYSIGFRGHAVCLAMPDRSKMRATGLLEKQPLFEGASRHRSDGINRQNSTGTERAALRREALSGWLTVNGTCLR